MALPTFTPGTEIKAQEMNDALATIFNMVYPVGSIYMSASLSTAGAVNAVLPGTWQAWGTGRVPVGVDTNQTEFNSVEKTGGAKNHTHGVSSAYADIVMDSNNIYYNEKSVPSWTSNYRVGASGGGSSSCNYSYGASLGGSTDSGSSLQPYITCYMYKRVS